MQGLAQAAGQHDGVDNPKYQCRNRKKTDSNALLSYGQAIDAYAVNHQGASGTAKEPATVNGGLAEQTIKQVNADLRVNKEGKEVNGGTDHAVRAASRISRDTDPQFVIRKN